MKDERNENERAKQIGWVSLVVDVAIMSVAISRTSSRLYNARLPKGSLASLAHLHDLRAVNNINLRCKILGRRG